jgi:hypothetical protein
VTEDIKLRNVDGDSAPFGSNRVEVTGGWRKLHNKKLHSFYSSWRMRWAQRVAYRYVQNFSQNIYSEETT